LARGLKEGAVGLAEVRLDFPGKKEALEKVEALRKRIIAGEIHVPSNAADLAAFKAAP
jgi:basic membrane protein A